MRDVPIMTECLKASLVALSVLATPPALAQSPPGNLPAGLVHLREIDAGIQQDIRYATANNFVGRKLPGYDAPECILTRSAAAALARVQADIRPDGLSLKVYDCYRPRRAARAMAVWSEAAQSSSQASLQYHPNVLRSELIALGYVAEFSTHSRADTVDATLVPLSAVGGAALVPAAVPGPCTGPAAGRLPDNSVDMGTGFDCFDPKSNTRSPLLTAEQRDWRNRLLRAMERRGFRNYPREWWHFTSGGGGPTYDFPIEAAPAARKGG